MCLLPEQREGTPRMQAAADVYFHVQHIWEATARSQSQCKAQE